MTENKIFHIAVGYLQTNCWIYPLGNNSCALIDPGDEAERIIAFLDNLKLSPEYILLSHGHFDHSTAAPFVAAEYKKRNKAGEGPKIAIHKSDMFLLDESFPADIFLSEGDKIGPFTVLHLPGHSPGSVGFWDRKAKVLFSGDTLFNEGYGRTDLPGGSGTQLKASLKRLFSMDAEIQVYPGHDQITTIAAESGKL